MSCCWLKTNDIVSRGTGVVWVILWVLFYESVSCETIPRFFVFVLDTEGVSCETETSCVWWAKVLCLDVSCET